MKLKTSAGLSFRIIASEAATGLPLIGEIRGPAKRISPTNKREWIVTQADCDRVNVEIAKGIQLRNFLSHPTSAINTKTGKFEHSQEEKPSISEIIEEFIDPHTGKFVSRYRLLKTEEGILWARLMKEIQDALDAGLPPPFDLPFSFRCFVQCTGPDNTGSCWPAQNDDELATPDALLVWDWLDIRIGEKPGIAGSKFSKILAYEAAQQAAACCNECRESRDPSRCSRRKNNNDKPANEAGAIISGGSNTNGDKKMKFSKILQMMFDNNVGWKEAEASLKDLQATPEEIADAKDWWLEASDSAMDGGEEFDDDFAMEGDDLEIEAGGMNKRAPRGPVRPAKQTIGRGSYYKPAMENGGRRSQYATGRNKAARERAVVVRRAGSEAATEPKVNEEVMLGLFKKFLPTIVPGLESISQLSKEEATEIFSSLSKSRERKNIFKTLDGEIKEAVKNKAAWESIPVFEVDKYPVAEVLAAVEKAGKEYDTLDKARGWLIGKLEELPEKARLATEVEKAKEAEKLATEAARTLTPSNVSFGSDRSYLEMRDKLVTRIADYAKGSRPDVHKLYESNKTRNDHLALEALRVCERTYGQRLLQYNKTRKAGTEAVQQITADQFHNYAVAMTAMMQFIYWTSPVMSLVGSVPADAMSLGRVVSIDGMNPIGQFIDIRTEKRAQRQTHDAAYRQLPGDAKPEILVQDRWDQYFAYYESTSIRLATELIMFLAKQPLNESVPDRALFNLMEEIRLYTEQRVATQILRAADRYKVTTITNETSQAVAAERNYNGAGGATLGGFSSPNAVLAVWMRRGNASGGTVKFGPVMRPGVIPTNSRGTVTLATEFPVTVNNGPGGEVQSRGKFDESNNIVKINPSDPDPTYAVHFDLGIAFFKANSGFDATNLPTFAAYGKVTNIMEFDFTAGAGEKTADIANRFVEKVGSAKGTISARNAPSPDFLLLPNRVNDAIAVFATHFQGQNALAFAQIASNYSNDQGFAAARFRNTDFLSTTEPLFANELRGVLGKIGLTVFQEIEAPEITGPMPGYRTDQNGVGQLTNERLWSLDTARLIATIPRRNPDGSEAEYPMGGFFFPVAPAASGLPL